MCHLQSNRTGRRVVGEFCRALASLISRFLLPCLLLSARIGHAQNAPPAALTPAQLETLIRSRMDEAGLMGLAGIVMVDGKLVWSNGFGYRDAERSKPFTVDTPMNVASITKTITGVAMMQLVAEGKLALDADINRYLPFPVRNPRYPETPITLRMLATHTSSIKDRWEIYRTLYRFGGDPVVPLGKVLADYFTKDARLWSEDNYLTTAPGGEREYSNMGAGLVGHIIERVTGERLDAYTKRRILVPLRMSASGWFLRDFPNGALSTLFVGQGGLPIPIPQYGTSTYPDGGVRASVNDLSRLFRALLNRGVLEGVRILPEREADEMLRFQFSGPTYPKGYGPGEGNSGLFWRTKFKGSRMGHGGNDPGVQAEMLASLDRRVAVIVMSNTSVSGEDSRAFGEIFMALWGYGESQRR
jgi:CubicO group peptidase (beta-lactamase class C family)